MTLEADDNLMILRILLHKNISAFQKQTRDEYMIIQKESTASLTKLVLIVSEKSSGIAIATA